MIKETGRVVAIDDDCLWVETIRQTTCNSCSAQKGCGHSLLNKVSSKHRNHLRVLLNQHPASDFAVGDEVELSVSEHVLVLGSFIVYLLPLLSMLVVASIFSSVWESDLMSFAGAVTGFVIGFVVVAIHAHRNKNNPSLQPALLGKLKITPAHDLILGNL